MFGKKRDPENQGNHAAKGNGYNFMVVFFAALGSFTYGFSSSIIGAVFGLPSFFAYFDLSLEGEGAKHGNDIIGAANGLFAGGGMIGALIISPSLNKFGRKLTIQAICVICVVASAIQGGSVHIGMFLAGRFLSGLGVGMMQVSVPIYQSELSPAKQRGRMVGGHGILIVCGYAMAAWTGVGCFFAAPEVSWRLCLSLQIVAPLILAIGSPWLPESPRWLIAHNREKEGLAVLQRLHVRPGDTNDIAAKEEYYQIRKQIELEAQTGVTTMWQMFKRRSYVKRILCGVLVQFAAQSTGVLVVNNYQVLLYGNLGLDGWLPLVLYGIYTSWAAFLNWINSLILDRIGRRPVIIFGLMGCVAMITIYTAMVAEYAGTDNRAGNAMGVLFLFLFVTFYGASQDASSYVYCAEIFPTGVRAQGLSIAIATLFGSTLLYTEAAPIAFLKVGWKYYLVFIIVPALCVPLEYLFLPETNGLTLEEIADKFGDEVAVDLSHLSEDRRRALDESLMAVGADMIETPLSGVDEKHTTTMKEKI
ncbi:uncharacterized protein LTR77_007227 [Saxophila tyrrhenica]|uniref:Major facilitator superfamily (MFS) profile domain-containing protein n=1 Tax=Saxophila tyrrhenica TaxID=1690608 RepID=A0AAV9P431_9PEZI|nr:hypothetical protein LTR77_007227 [Saxophila tyrrhenica]